MQSSMEPIHLFSVKRLVRRATILHILKAVLAVRVDLILI